MIYYDTIVVTTDRGIEEPPNDKTIIIKVFKESLEDIEEAIFNALQK